MGPVYGGGVEEVLPTDVGDSLERHVPEGMECAGTCGDDGELLEEGDLVAEL